MKKMKMPLNIEKIQRKDFMRNAKKVQPNGTLKTRSAQVQSRILEHTTITAKPNEIVIIQAFGNAIKAVSEGLFFV